MEMTEGSELMQVWLLNNSWCCVNGSTILRVG